ncbi:cell division protein FtsQ/DivIB [Paenibacillus thermotolerans]|uniref:cell division protein FtsQ/DivIB n=1 Tax=Paenibacillus thermotolerans TaxID=3027807 RepID=UPI0023687F54|nr:MULTISPECIES: FtsQ-type POTRA domain-containing protein [unclassified Paenibacillus]
MPELQPMPVVRGTRPKRRSNKKLLLLLFLFFIALMGVLFFQSSFSKIHKIDVTGAKLLATGEIIEAAGIKTGDHFFAKGAKDMERGIEKLGAVESVKVTKRFPGGIRIDVKEFPVVALEIDDEGKLVGLLSSGFPVPYTESADAAPGPLLTGWTDQELKKSLCLALGSIPPELMSDVSEIRPIPIDSYPDRILMYTRSRYEVITRIAYLPQKIPLLDDYVYDMKSGGRTEGRIFLLETDYGNGFDDGAAGESAEEPADKP